MASASSSGPDWCEGEHYASLLRADPAAIAWEWLRRDSRYRIAASDAPHLGRGSGPAVRPADPAAAPWGLHAFEHPSLPATMARPVWRRGWHSRVLVASAQGRGPPEDRFDLARFAAIATLVRDADGPEHLLLSDGEASLRLDVEAGSLLEGPVCLTYHLAGLAALRGPLEVLSALRRLGQSGRLDRAAARSRNRRHILLLRAHDALQAGASQREIATVLLSGEAALARWRSEAPSLRSRSQRLVKGARAMARGGYRALLEA